jgi:Uma2 family endonuclease
MSTTLDQKLTLADVLRQLGGISPRRIRFHPAPGKATEDDVVKIRDRERRLFELVDGVLVVKVMGYWESVLAIELARLLGNFVKRRKLGTLAGEAGMLRLSPGLVRIPDLSFITRARIAQHRRALAPIPPLAPDLAIEVLSEGNTPREMARKVGEYFASGCRLVRLVDCRTRMVAVNTSVAEPIIVTEKQTLTGGDVFPGFRLSIRASRESCMASRTARSAGLGKVTIR